MTDTQKRFDWADPLRIIAIFAVMLTHISARDWYRLDVAGAAWQICNFYDSLSRWSVACFIMISGAIFLSRPLDVKKLYSKNILRIMTAYFFWSVLYAFFGLARKEPLIERIIAGATHLWFCRAAAGIYIMLPLLKKISEDRKLTDYYLKTCFVCKFLLPAAARVLEIFGYTKAIGSGIFTFLNSFYLGALFGLPFYFLLGHRLAHAEFSPKTRKAVYAAGILGVAATIFLTSCASVSMGRAYSKFYGSFTLSNLSAVVALFIFAKYNLKSGNFMRKMSEYTFGAYLVHAFFDIYFSRAGIVADKCPLLLIPAIAVAVFVCSYIASAILNHIPYIRKYIV